MEVFSSSLCIKLLFLVLIFAKNQLISASLKKNVEERTENRNYSLNNIATTNSTTTNYPTTSIPTTNSATTTSSALTTSPATTTTDPATSTDPPTTTEPPCDPLSIPRELKANQITSISFNLTWLEPVKITDLVGYNITIIRGNSSCENRSWTDLPEQESEYSVSTNESYLFFQNASADFEYTVSVRAWSKTGSGCPASINFLTSPAVPKIQSISIDENLQTNVNLSISLTDDQSVCYPIEIKVNCTANNEWECVIKETNYMLQMNSSTIDFTLDGLSEATSYTCLFEIADSNSTSFSFQTTEYVPYIKNISINNIFKTEVNLSINLTTENERLCPPRDLLVNCTSTDPWSWVIKETTYELQLFSLTHDFSLGNLSEFTNYTCNFEILGSNSTNLHFQTAEDAPTSPENVNVSNITSSSFFLMWSEPSKIPTNLKGYNISIGSRRKNNSTFLSNCNQTEGDIYENFTEENVFYFKDGFPDFDYDVTVWAASTAGLGKPATISKSTLVAEPQILDASNTVELYTNDVGHYNVSAIIEFTPGCFNGEFDSYIISFIGTRNDYNYSDSEPIYDYQNTTYHISLKPEYRYVVNVTIKNSKLITNKTINFTSPTGVPLFDDTIFEEIKPVSSTTEAKLTLKKSYFSDTSGTLQYIAIIVSSSNTSAGNFDLWKDDSKWPVPSSNETEIYYQATPKFWYPFKDTDYVDYNIGEDQSCSTGQQFCNAPLQPGKTYFVFLRMFNANYYRNTLPIIIITNPLSRLGLILGIIFGFSIAIVLGFIGFILWRKGILNITNKCAVRNPSQRNQCQYETAKCTYDYQALMKYFNKEESDTNVDININKFIEYCNYLENNPNELNKQWQELEVKSEEMYSDLSNYFSVLPENKRKNRFTNILPFDHSRVKLNIDEDDEICSDYINASYIKGFSNRHEYIATQGPLPHTVRDFWKMIFQENVTIIVMVAKFIENKREKCYKYFPNNHETILFGDDIEIRCSAELNFQIYCVRTLQVRKDIKQITVTHLQFLEWPDFGVPEGTDNLLHFCHQLRERWTNEGGMAVVHCSAGVGRTGTIIATDILIRAIQAEKKIDVFDTVLELRRQRKLMVQTEKQYLYIHQLLRSILEDPIIEDDENQEHLYQNVELASEGKNGIVESAF